ncbi:BQ5605_C017g08419 [Microbotryum silenes-dioicae]|uniref:BQ5605_C017g08419 protein n=1 Tax=Microbotryum silenes-dioicae TaxID=796604 RepID=A0A2X0MGD6_9BASI|nr:BQ5605_C017g08419 [Microbotryum silenes-dioicae]
MSRIDKGVHIFYRRYPVLAPSLGRYDEKWVVTYHCEEFDRSPNVIEMRIAEVIGLS